MPSVCDPVHTGRAGSSPILSAYGPHPLPRWLRIPRRVRRGGARPPDAAARPPATPHGAGGQRHGAGVVLGAEAVLQRGGGRARPAGPPRPRDARRARVQRRVLRARWQDRARPGGDRALACRRPRHRRRHRVRSRPSRGRRGRRSLGRPHHGARGRVHPHPLYGPLPRRHVGIRPGPACARPDAPRVVSLVLQGGRRLERERAGRARAPAVAAAPVAEPTYLAPGVVLRDRYEIAQEIGRGGFSVVYRARDRSVGADVAIKLLVPPPAAARLARERLRREVQVVRQLSHPNIVAVYDVADDGAWSFVVMEYVPGPDLAVRVRERGPLDAAATALLGREVAAALEAAHRRGILHRDVKPQNILLAPDGRARLTDFGSARLAGLETVTQTGGLVGTVDYAAPEQLAGDRGDARVDEYALGVTLYYALTGELPARVASRGGADAGRDGHHPRRRRPDVPGWIDDVVGRATMPDPDDRFPAIELVAEALERGDDGVGAGVAPLSGGRARCVLCRAPEPFGIGVCPRCAGRAGGGDDVLVFLERTTPGPARRAVREALDERIGGAASAA